MVWEGVEVIMTWLLKEKWSLEGFKLWSHMLSQRTDSQVTRGRSHQLCLRRQYRRSNILVPRIFMSFLAMPTRVFFTGIETLRTDSVFQSLKVISQRGQNLVQKL